MRGPDIDRFHYNVALSFAGEQRRYVKRVWHALNKCGLKVFYDQDPAVQVAHLGRRFSEVAQRVYGEAAEFVVIFASKEYITKQWPYTEGALILDRMREELFQGDKVFLGRFDDSLLPGFPKDVWYTDLTLTRAKAFAETLHKAIELRRQIDQAHILGLFSRQAYADIKASLSKSLERKDVKYNDRVFGLYNRACALSRLSETSAPQSADHLAAALVDLTNCFVLVRANRLSHVGALATFGNQDDDLLALRVGLPDRMKQLLGVEVLNLVSSRKDYKHVGNGCVSPDALVGTPSGPLPMQTVCVSSSVLSYSPRGRVKLRASRVLHKHTYGQQPRYSVNGKIIVSSTQPLYERGLGWSCAPAWKPGMELLKSDGSYEAIVELRQLESGTVMVIGVNDDSHTFIADGFVCHNIEK